MNFIELKEKIIDTLNKDVKDADDLLGVCAWALSRAKSLLIEIHGEEEETPFS